MDYATPGSEQKAPQVEENAPDLSGPVELWTFIDNYRFVSGKMVHLTVQLLWKLGINVNTEKFENVDLSPFKVENVTIGERQIFNNDRDYQLITFMLSLPDDKEEGLYTIPSITIPYKDEVNKITGQATTSPIPLKKVPIMVEASVDKDVVNLGDRIHYQIMIWHERYIEILKENLKTFKFDPFKMLDCNFREETDGRLKKLIVDYDISVYDLAEEENTLEIPSLPVLYYKQTDEVPEREEGEELFVTQQVSAPAILVLMNSLLKKVDVPLESVKGIVTYPKRNIYLRGYLPIIFGAIIIAVLGVLEMRKYAGKISSIVREKVAESPKVHAEKLEELVEGFNCDAESQELRKSVVNTGYALRVFLGALAEVPKESILSFTTTKIIQTLKMRKVADNLIEPACLILKTFDSAIFGKADTTELEKAVHGIKDLLKEAKKRGYC
ncbi:MAG: hypothetical protein MRK02_11640 [Candidatus Scalindua sp.]|nr:hypothetical protein [Candidatus Scalindua sp.]